MVTAPTREARANSQLDGRQILVEWCGTTSPYTGAECVQELIAGQASQRPDAVALAFQGRSMGYGELDRRGNQLAHYLRKLGVRLEDRVVLSVDRSPDLVIGILGALKAGAAYVPIAPGLPAERRRFIMADSGAKVILTQEHLRADLPPSEAAVVYLDADWPIVAHELVTSPMSGVGQENLAYIIYTSGSTGEPKGVLVEHRGLTNIIVAQVKAYGIVPESRVLQSISINFDVAQAEIFRALVGGATLCMNLADDVLPGRPLFNVLRDQRITLITILPAPLSTLPLNETLPELKTLVMGGEQCPVELAAHWARGRNMFNGYGPTEATVCTTIGSKWDLHRPPPVGRPVANARVYLLDEGMQPLPVDTPGELFIGGVGVSRGYLNQPELTAERFLPDPFSDAPGRRMYRTGDRMRWRPDGNLEFLGRTDDQVKLRGFRIELGEIETVLGQYPEVLHGVAIVREDRPGDKRLVAYVVARREPGPTAAELRGYLKEKLPEYMVPSAFVFMRELPRTTNDKVDRRILPAPPRTRPDIDTGYVAPRDPGEDTIATIWSQVLGIDEVGIQDNFFELGGNSLLATQAVARLRETLRLEVPLKSLMDEPTVVGLAKRIADLRTEGAALRVPSMGRADRTGALPLSFAQRRLWFIDQLEPGNALYNLPAAMRLRGLLNQTVLKRCLDEIVRRHEALRTTFTTIDGKGAQIINAPTRMPLPVHDLGQLPAHEREARAMAFARAEALKPFDLARGPLIRPTLVRLASDDHYLIPMFHHAIFDAWSLALFTKELAVLYDEFVAGRPSPLPEPEWQYADFAVWQRNWLTGDVLENQLAYWRKQLADLPHALELPTDGPRPAVQRFRGDQHDFLLPPSLLDSLDRMGRAEGVTLYMTLLAAFQVLLSRLSGQQDVAVGSPVAGRNHRATEDIIGLFVNILVLRADLSADPTFQEFLAQVKKTCLGAFAHQDVPFEKLVDDLRPERDLSRSPLFQAAFILQNAPPPTLKLRSITISQIDVDQGTAKSDISLSMAVTEQGLAGHLVYNTDLFEVDTIERFAGHFRTLLEGIIAGPDRHVSALPVLNPTEEARLLRDWNATAYDYPRERCVHQLIESQTVRTPDAIALICQGQSLTYRELNRRANHLAWRLRELGVGPEATVALCVERSPEAVVGMLGVLKAGGAYVPMAASLPAERLAFMLADSVPRVILTRSDLRYQLTPHTAPLVDLDTYALATRLRFTDADDNGPQVEIRPENLAYITFTSGSTGRPKGVMVPHGGLTNVILEHVRTLDIKPGDRYPNFLYLHFDAAQAEIYRAFVAGATLVQAPPDLLMSSPPTWELLARERVTMVGFTPPVLRVLDEQYMRGVDNLIISAEVCPAELAAKWMPGRKVWNAYGPTETTICSTLATDWDPQRSPPIGRPIANTQAYVLDRHLQPVPIGVCGELYIGGDGVTRGYLNRPELTAEAFIPDCFGSKPGARLYKSGDLVRWLPDGNLDFIGRVDNQVKLRGFRIELGEIENALRQHAALSDNAVIAREDVPGTKQLVAYVVSNHDPAPTDAELRNFLEARLPEYMVPTAYVFMAVLPRLHMGKINRKELPLPDQSRTSQERPHAAPRSQAEVCLAEIWSSVLRREPIGIHDNFFMLGGDSISSIQVIARANRAGLRLRAADLFQHQTIAELAAVAADPPTLSDPLDGLQEELAYWIAALSKKVTPLQVYFVGAANGHPATLSVELDPIETGHLLHETAHGYRIRVAEVLLTALLRTWESQVGQGSVRLDLDVPISDDEQIPESNVAFPCILDLPVGTSAGDALIAVKDQLRAVPNEGRGFAALKSTPQLRDLPAAPISFQYRRGAMAPTPDEGHLLYVSCFLEGGRLRAEWTYDSNAYRRSTIENLALAFLERLRELIAHCRSAEGGRVTPADFPEARMTQDELAQLLSAIGQVEESDGR